MAKKQGKASMRGVTGGAGALVGFGIEAVPQIAEGNFCPAHRNELVTQERAAKGDLAWGDWVLGWQVARDAQGRVRTDGTPQQNVVLEPLELTSWRRADRLTGLYRSKSLSNSMLLAGERLAALAEQADMIGLRSTFGAYKVDGSSGELRTLPTSPAQAARMVRAAMSILGGSNSLTGGVTWLVAVCGVSLNAIEGYARWDGRKVPREGALGVLQGGLDLLALGFRFAANKAA